MPPGRCPEARPRTYQPWHGSEPKHRSCPRSYSAMFMLSSICTPYAHSVSAATSQLPKIKRTVHTTVLHSKLNSPKAGARSLA